MIYGDTVHFVCHSENSSQMCLNETRGSCCGSSTLIEEVMYPLMVALLEAWRSQRSCLRLQAAFTPWSSVPGTAATSRGQETPQKLGTITEAFFCIIFAFPCFNPYFLSRFHFPLCKATHISNLLTTLQKIVSFLLFLALFK